MYSLQGKVVWITGSSSGIGRAAALAFAEHGADVIVHGYSNMLEAREVVGEIEKMGRKALLVMGHAGNFNDVVQMVEHIKNHFNQLDILVNNAGSLIQRARLEELDEKLWNETIDVNLKTVYLVTKTALPLLKKSIRSRVINITSISARNGGGYGSIAYVASKGGVSSLTRALAKDLIEYNITVNAVSPGIISTPLHDRVTPKEIRDKLISSIPMGREGTVKEIVGVIMFLASEHADYITGEIIEVNGGQLMG
jgi:3-oxoacyl-[acyl-carrier protein] reductase